ncbi:MAG: NADPH-dependent assimilatory sulfite reductase hemoprotein subunit, partial [Planctomyces sp.]
GGNVEGTRLGFIYKDHVPQEELATQIAPLLKAFKADRKGPSESFGDFCQRKGIAELEAIAG